MTQAFILAGGEGIRLQPLTLVNPKSMISIMGKPFLEYLLLLLKKNGITDIVISVGYLASQIRNYFNDGSYWGLDIKYSFEVTPLGTGGALRLAEDLLEDEFFFVNGDTYLDLNYDNMARKFRSSNKPMMMAVCRAEKSNCLISTNGNLIRYSRKGLSETYVDAGVWILNKKIFDMFPERKSFMMEDYCIPWGSRMVKTFISEKKFIDIGTFGGLEKFRRYAKEKIL